MLIYFELFLAFSLAQKTKHLKGKKHQVILIIWFCNIFRLFGRPCYISLFPSSLSSDQDKFKPPFNTHTEGTIEIVRIKSVEFREYVRALLFPFPQGQSKLSVVSGCP